ncbi:MAG: hypothetical protein M4579_002875 [Chaenotheca gracillima]|nr:MAG: hypothetical protein M4579_002875 [Chaenotheca gracillima]
MPSSKDSSANHNRNGTQQSQTSKRKPSQLSGTGSEAPDSSKSARQSVISQHFSSSQRKTVHPEVIDLEESPPPKRQKSVPPSEKEDSSVEALRMSIANVGGTKDHFSMTASLNGQAKSSTVPWTSNVQSNFQPRAGAKRMTIKNLREPKVSSHEAIEKIWKQTEAALTAVFTGGKLERSFEQLYRDVQTVCQYGEEPFFFEKLRDRCLDHARNAFEKPLAEEARVGKSDIAFVQSVVTAWTQWNEQLSIITRIFYYLDRSFLLHSTKYPTINTLRIETFRKHVLRSSKIVGDKTWNGIIDLVNLNRDAPTNEATNLLSRSIAMAIDLDVYRSPLESKLIQSSGKWFEEWANHQTSTLDLGRYINEIQTLLKTESARCREFNFLGTTEEAILGICREKIVAAKADYLVAPEAVAKLLDDNAVKEIGSLFSLLQRSKLSSRLKDPWHLYAKSHGAEILKDESKRSEMIIRLLELKTTLDHIREIAFSNDYDLGLSLREAFSAFINERKEGQWHNIQSKVGESIAKYIDLLLRGGVKAIPSTLSSKRPPAEDEDEEISGDDEDAELSKQLDRVLDLFRFIEGKDVFEAFYKKDLARRLLMARSASADAERSMLARLRHECGASFTHNLETMFKDVDLARDEMSSYKAMRAESGTQDSLDLSVNVLSASAWPTYPDVPVNMPKEIISHIDKYDRHYKQKHTGRRLYWKHALAHCVLKAKFGKGNKEIIVSSFQAIVMLLFNNVTDGGQLGYNEIQAATNLSHVELKRTLQSLACAKYRVLTKTPKGRDVNETDSFAVNLGFSDIKYRIKINQIQLKETKEEIQATHEDINRDRQYETQAAIVRIMKSKKSIGAQALMAQTIDMTKKRGRLSPPEIKQQIEKLIDKEYIEREMKNTGLVYNYLA